MKKRKVLGILVVVLTLLVVFSGCGRKSKEIQEVNLENEMRVVSTLKGEVSIPANPKRIADISGASEELLILGFLPVATANTDPYNTNEFASYIKDQMVDVKIVGFSMMDTMDVEAILATEPDLIIMSQRQEKIYEQLKAIAPVVMMQDYENDWRTKMTDVAKLFDKEIQVEKWFKEYDDKTEVIAKEILEESGGQTYLTVLASGGQFYIFNDAGIGAILYNDMGLAKPVNMPPQDGISLPVVTMEGLSEIDADHIVVIATDADKKDLKDSTVWNNIRAVKEDSVTILDSTPYFGQGYNPIGRELLLDLIKEKIIKK